MQGYDANEALSYIKSAIDRKPFAELCGIDGYLSQAQALDIDYMHESGALDADGFEGDAYYDDDDAFEYIVEEIIRLRGLSEDEGILVASLVDAYMRAQDAYLRKTGLYSGD